MLNHDAGKIVAVRKKRIIFDLDTAVLDVRNREYTMFSGCVKACGVSSKEYFARRKDGESVRYILRNVCHYGDKEIEGVELALRENANNPDSWAADCLYDGVKNALHQLHDVGFELIAFSLRIDEVAVSAQLRTFGVFDLFEEVVCLGVEKKNTLKALNDKIRLCEKDMIVSGDTYVIKIVPQFKALSVAVCYGSVGRSCFKELEPDFYVDNIGQLVGWGRLLLDKDVERLLCISQTTNAQHYVQDKFLQAWSLSGTNIFVCREGRVRPSKTGNVAHANDIYGFETLSMAEFMQTMRIMASAQERFNDPTTGPLIRMALTTTILYEAIFGLLKPDEIRDLCRAAQSLSLLTHDEIAGLEMLSVLIAQDEPINYFRKGLRRRFNEGFEPVMCQVENDAEQIVQRMRQGDLGFWNEDPKCMAWYRYVGFQLVRTMRFVAVAEARPDLNPKTMKLLRPVYAEKLARVFFEERAKYAVRILENDTPLEFITGDHPLVNLDCGTPVLHFDLYFPLSSTHAFFMCEKNRLGCYPEIDSLTVQDVDRLNRRLAEGCLKEVYAGRKETLEHGCYKASFDVNSLIEDELNGKI